MRIVFEYNENGWWHNMYTTDNPFRAIQFWKWCRKDIDEWRWGIRW